MTDAFIEAAQSLIVRLAAPAQYHSVWIKAEVNEDGEMKKSLCVSIRPGQINKIKVPDEHLGIPVVQVPWPKGS